MRQGARDRLRDLVTHFDHSVRGMAPDGRRIARDGSRAFGGYLRSKKGRLHEGVTEELVRIALEELLGLAPERLEINSKKIPIQIDPEWVASLEDLEVRNAIESEIDSYAYGLSVDKHVWVDGRFIAGLESKAYTENAMIKRILVDFRLLRGKHPNLLCYLVQLESQLGGDFADVTPSPIGSKSTNTLMSHFPDVPLRIITLLKGERKVDEPIHEPQYFKELDLENLERVTERFAQDFREALM